MGKSEGKAEYMRAAEAMYEELREWREAHPEASFDEIAAQVTPKRRELMGELLGQLAQQQGDGRYEATLCESCGETLSASGRRKRRIVHAEGEVEVVRAYHHCAECGSGLFPPGPPIEADKSESHPQDN